MFRIGRISYSFQLKLFLYVSISSFGTYTVTSAVLNIFVITGGVLAMQYTLFFSWVGRLVMLGDIK